MNSGWKSTLTERDCHAFRRIILKNHTTTAAQMSADLNIHLEDHISTKIVWHKLHKFNIHGRAAIDKPQITESNAQVCKRWCHDHKTWTSDNWKRACDMVRWVILHAIPYIRKSLRLEYTQGSLQSGIPVPTVKHLGGSLVVWAAISWYSILLVLLLPFVAELLQGVCGQVG
jgi:hypothetical protein